MPVDIRGKELKVGQLVSYPSCPDLNNRVFLKVSRVLKIHPKVVEIEDFNLHMINAKRRFVDVAIVEDI